MIFMGRRKSVHKDLPPRMVCRVLKSGKRLYYYGRNKIPLGSDLAKAREQWAKFENDQSQTPRFPVLAKEYALTIIPGLRQSTQREYRRAIENLSITFAEFCLDDFRPTDVKEYMVRRSSKIAAIREKAVLSAFFTWARHKGHTDKPNPCTKVGFSQQEMARFEFKGSRDRYVTEPEYAEVWNKAEPVLRDFMDLCLLTSQRPGDILRWSRKDIREGALYVRQSKTGKELRIRVEGALKSVLERIQARPRTIQTMFLLADPKGQRLTVNQMNYRFNKVRGNADWQIRDLRAKAVSDEPDIRVAQQRAGHKSELTTAQVYRRLRGDEVGPLR